MSPVKHWTLDSADSPDFAVDGKVTVAGGVRGNSLKLDGHSVLSVKDNAGFLPGDKGFTFTIWVNPYAFDRDQQMIAARNRYSRNEREWGVMVDRDGHFRLYVQQGGWKTAGAGSAPKPGHWHQVGVIVRPARAELWVNGRLAESIPLNQPVPRTKAPFTLDGISDNGAIRQTFLGALDEAMWFDRALSTEEMAALYTPVRATHDAPKPLKPFVIWDESQSLAKADELPVIEGAEFHVIKKWDKPTDGYTFLHGVGLAWHKGKLYVGFSNNGGRRGNLNSAELAVIPIKSLRIDP